MAVTADNTSLFRFKQQLADGYAVDYPVAASTTIYKDTFVGLDTTGYLVSYAAKAQAATPTWKPLLGIAIEHVDNSSGLDAAKTCRVQVQGIFYYALSAAARTDVGMPVYAYDNATLTKANANYDYVGVIVDVPATGYVVVDMGGYAHRKGWNGGLLTRTANVDFAGTVNTGVYLVHETENHNGLILHSCNAITTEVFACDTTVGVVTICHTLGTYTTMGCTLSGVDNMASSDIILGVGGCMFGASAADGTAVNATNAALVAAAADKAIIARCTQLCNDAGTATGQARITATFVPA